MGRVVAGLLLSCGLVGCMAAPAPPPPAYQGSPPPAYQQQPPPPAYQGSPPPPAYQGSPPPPAYQGSPPPPPVANVDSGQPRMQAAQAALQRAEAALQRATPNKGGHRERAIQIIRQAMGAVEAGMQYAASHPGEAAGPGPALPPVYDENVPGAERQPNMAQAIAELREARQQLREARHDKGGYRVQALNLIEQALGEVRLGIRVGAGVR